MELVVSFLRNYPQVAIFLCLAGGYWIGKWRFWGLSLGSTASVLLVGLIIGQMDIPITSLLKNVSFALFIFTIGYKVGPQFFGSLKSEGLQFAALSVFFAVVALITAYLLSVGFGFDRGTAAGVLGGALTQSSVIGTADGAIMHLSESAAEQKIQESNVAVAYAITYLFGTAGLILFFKFIPHLLGVNLREEAARLEKEMSAEEEAPPELFSWSNRIDLRCYEIAEVAGKSIQDIEALFPENVEIKRVLRDGKLIEPEASLVLQTGDHVAVIGHAAALTEVRIGEEKEIPALRQVMGEVIRVCVLNKDIVGSTLGALNRRLGHGVFLQKVLRQGHELPLTAQTTLHSCDILELAGPKEEIECAVAILGYPERPTSLTDLVLVGLGCAFGTLIGLLAIKIGGVPITLGVGGGVLVAGLLCGYLRALHPTFGQIPTAAQWIFTDLGLNLFIACVGITAGPKAIEAMEKLGPSIFFAGVLLSLIPHCLSLLFGRYILRLPLTILLGAMTGAGTITAALNALKEEAHSSIPVLGYTVPYAIGNVLLTVWGTLIVYLV